ncbi:hypothetical protein U9M48_036589 [Paspalum notatum var. saurae]|uniref:F-box domain-containing protein n=1 Tax=Paspalum notatum var. saurae TaxID=547442 RepID=A0AAQ3UHJ0_PASNO
MEPMDGLVGEAGDDGAPARASRVRAVVAELLDLDELVGEILIRIRPGEPACLVRASLVCKRWHRFLSDPNFRRRYRAFHKMQIQMALDYADVLLETAEAGQGLPDRSIAEPGKCRGAYGSARAHRAAVEYELDTHDNADLFVNLQLHKKRSKIVEIVAAKDIIFVLAQSGLATAFNRATNKRIAFLNLSSNEVIRTLFYNKNNNSFITVSVCRSDDFNTLKCRTTPIEYIRRNQLDAGFPIFESENLMWPGFVEFDDVNGKALTYSANDGIYKVFDLKTYSFLYSIQARNVQDIKIRAHSHVQLKILSIEDGKPLTSLMVSLKRNKRIDFIEKFNEKLLVKQQDENLRIIDLRSCDQIEVDATKFITPSRFVFLNESNIFLSFRSETVSAWNLRGELVTSFEDHLLWDHDSSLNNIYITSNEGVLISYCKSEDVAPIGSINMSQVRTGKCITKFAANDPTLSVVPRTNSCTTQSSVLSTVQEVPVDVTALFYNEDMNEIYTGNSKGLVHVWSNRS